MSKVWFITGTSKGFGRIWAEAALGRGDRVVATARNADTLTPLVEAYGDLVLPLTLDVTDKSAIDAAVKQAHEHFGRLDVVVNNAGYGLFGAIEEITEEQARDQVETNLFGPLWVTQAVLPILREQGSGHIIQVSTIGGVNAFPVLGLYHASKWGLEGFSQSLAAEVAGFGIKVTLVEPAGLLDRLARTVGGRGDADARVRRDPRLPREAASPARSPSRGDPEATGAGDPRARRRRRAAAAHVLRHRHAGHDPRRVREAPRGLGAVGPPGRLRAGRREGMTAFGFETTALEVVEGIDLAGKRAIVTGGASGIGIETARALASAGAEVTLAVRDVAAGERVATEVGATGGAAYLDLANLESVDAFARGWDGPLHILVNNAGVMAIPELTLNGDGLEMQFATNHVGHFALADRPARRAGGRGRADRLRQLQRAPALAGDLRRPQLRVPRLRGLPRLRAVQDGERAVLGRRDRPLGGRRHHSNALMPGGIATALQRHQPPDYIEQARKFMTLKTPEQGAATSVLLAASPGAGGHRRPLLRGLRRGAGRRAARRARDRRRRSLRAGRRQRRPPVGSCPSGCSERTSAEPIRTRGWEPLHPRERFQISAPGPIIPTMPWLLNLIMDLLFGPEDEIAYVSVTARR